MKPTGRGAWVAFEDAVTPQGRAEDIAATIDRAKRLGARWVALRIGAGGAPDAGTMARGMPRMDLVDALRAAGLGVYVWLFEYALYPTASRGIWLAWAKIADGAIINAEFEYLNATKATAEELVSDLRAMGYDYVAHAPPDYAGGRGDGALKYLDAVCDEIMPQVYGYEHNDQGHAHHLDAVRALYIARGVDLAKVSPIGCTYRPFKRGGKALDPIGDAAVAADVVAFCAHSWTQASSAPSLYSIDALAFAGEGRDAVLAAVEAWDAEHAPTDPPTPFDPRPPALREEPTGIPSLTDVLRGLSEPDTEDIT